MLIRGRARGKGGFAEKHAKVFTSLKSPQKRPQGKNGGFIFGKTDSFFGLFPFSFAWKKRIPNSFFHAQNSGLLLIMCIYE
jgi:hypothetical protein